MCGLSAELNSMDAETARYVFSGSTSNNICGKLKVCNGSTEYSHIFLHTGDIDARNNRHNAKNCVLGDTNC